MNIRSILKGQTGALLADLDQIENILDILEAANPLPDIHTTSDHLELLARVRPRFDTLVRKQRVALEALEGEIDGGRATSDCWGKLRAIRLDCKKLFQECLALIEGSLVRRHGIDGGLSHLADMILAELSRKADVPWRRFTIWADGESFSNLAEVIRLRFPSVSIWHLPVVAHEFGHFVSGELKVPGTYSNPYREVCDRYKGSEVSAFLPEYFADIFAAYSVGPSYVCAALLMRFDHGAADRAARYHPSDAARVHVLLRTLERMDHNSGVAAPQFEYVRGVLAALWRDSLAAAFQPTELDANSAAALDELWGELYGVIADELPPGLRYGGWLRAQRLSHVLRSPEGSRAALDDADTMIDVLNAAWLCRLGAGDDLAAAPDISRRALNLCEAVRQRVNALRDVRQRYGG